MADLVQKFEATYAKSASATNEAPRRSVSGDDLLPEFEAVFPERADKHSADTLPAAATARRAREPLWGPETIPARRPVARPKIEEEIDLDEAISILRAPELERARSEESTTHAANALAGEHATEAQPRTPAKAPQAQQARGGMNWSTKSHRPHSIAIAAAVLALIIGVVVGYVAGHHPGAVKTAAGSDATQTIKSKLRLDYDLQKR